MANLYCACYGTLCTATACYGMLRRSLCSCSWRAVQCLLLCMLRHSLCSCSCCTSSRKAPPSTKPLGNNSLPFKSTGTKKREEGREKIEKREDREERRSKIQTGMIQYQTKKGTSNQPRRIRRIRIRRRRRRSRKRKVDDVGKVGRSK